MVDVVRAVTPTVVVVSSERDEEENWDSSWTRKQLRVGDKVMGLAERRRLLLVGREEAGNGMSRGRERDLLMQNRKSERVVVEMVSVLST